MNRLKLYAIVITVLLVILLIFAYLYPTVVNYCVTISTDVTLRNIMLQIEMRGNPILISVDNKQLICDIFQQNMTLGG